MYIYTKIVNNVGVHITHVKNHDATNINNTYIRKQHKTIDIKMFLSSAHCDEGDAQCNRFVSATHAECVDILTKMCHVIDKTI